MRLLAMRRESVPVALCLLAAVPRLPAQDPVSAWLDFQGQIPGGATDKAHADWIEIRGFDVLGGTDLAGDISLVKNVDRASPPLLLGCGEGTSYSVVTLDLKRPDGLPDAQLARLELGDVRIASQQTNADAGAGFPIEKVGLSFRKITYTYFLLTGGSVSINFDHDSDIDGMPDTWETLYNLVVGTNDAADDADGDGLSNLDEYLLGTHPRAGSSFFQARISTVAGSPQTYRVSWNSVIGKTYVVEWSPNLLIPFTPLSTATATALETSVELQRPETLGFFRVRPQ